MRSLWSLVVLAVTGIVLGTMTAAAEARPAGLYDCGTRVEDKTGVGWCRGTGAFRVAVSCADGSEKFSGYLYVRYGFGYGMTSCQSAAQSARIVNVETLDNCREYLCRFQPAQVLTRFSNTAAGNYL